MKSGIVATIILAGIMVSSPLLGQEKHGNAGTSDRQTPVKKDMTLLKRDQDELDLFRKKTDRFNKAWENNDLDKLQRTKVSLVSDMKREISQGNKYTRRYKKELRRDQIKNRYEKRDIGEDRLTDHPPVNDRAERRDRKLHQRDMRGNYRALDKHNDIVRRQKGILNAFKNYDFQYTRKDMASDKKRGLLDDFARTMEEDLNLKKAKNDR